MIVTLAEGLRLAAVLIPFDAGKLRGESVFRLSQLPDTGKMRPEDAFYFRDAQRRRREGYLAGRPASDFPDAPVYIVYSYSTPVVWVTSDGTVNVTDGNLSTTSNNHRAMAEDVIRNGRGVAHVVAEFAKISA